jgi:hypothetical protein
VNEDGPTLSQTVLPITAPAECRGAGTQPQVSKLFRLDVTQLAEEWKYARRTPDELQLSVLASCDRLRATFPGLSNLAVRLLLLPIGTASCERSFSTMNRVLCFKRSQLTASHLQHLLSISQEGPQVPHPRNVGAEADIISSKFDDFLQNFYKQFMKFSHRL